MCLTGASTADQNHVVRLNQKHALGLLVEKTWFERGLGKIKVRQFLGQRKPGLSHPVADRADFLVADLDVQQIGDHPGRRKAVAPRRVHRLVGGGDHTAQQQLCYLGEPDAPAVAGHVPESDRC